MEENDYLHNKIMHRLKPFKGVNCSLILKETSMQGLIEKKNNTDKLLSMSKYQRRYVIIDFIRRNVYIKHNYNTINSSSQAHIIKFKDV
jgi:hypothetical protein